MLTRVTIENFKRFQSQVFDLAPVTVLAGPNNSGKSTLLQALSAWAFALRRWQAGKGAEGNLKSGNGAKRRGQAVARRDFTPLPLGHFSLLWNERATKWRNKDKKESVRVGSPRPVRVKVEGNGRGNAPWELTLNFHYDGSELIYVKPIDVDAIPQEAQSFSVTHCSAFSGIGAAEPHYDRGYIDLKVGEGKPGDTLRNLLLDIANTRDANKTWNNLVADIKTLFGVELQKPVYVPTQPFIQCEYKERGIQYDLASGGSGLHQALLLLCSIYAQDNTLLLLDEPDAHQHIWLQEKVFDLLRSRARQQDTQLIIATHAETIINATKPKQILSFVGEPHLLKHDTDPSQLLEVVRVSPQDYLLAEQGCAVLYCEEKSDARILKAWAQCLEHPATEFFKNPLVYPLAGHDLSKAKRHLRGLQAVRPSLRGLLLLDRDNREHKDHDIGAENLEIHRWSRYEIENYLLVPDAIERVILNHLGLLFAPLAISKVSDVFEREFPPSVLESPTRDVAAVVRTRASKEILPEIFGEPPLILEKVDYYQIAEVMKPEEVHPEVVDVLDKIAALPDQEVA